MVLLSAKERMMRILVIVMAMGLLVPGGVLAQNRDMFNGLDAWELTRGVAVQTTCEIEAVYAVAGEFYCFSSFDALERFNENLQHNVARALDAHDSLVGRRTAQEGRLPYPAAALALQSNTLYANTFPSGALYTLNASTAAARLVGSLRRSQVTDVAFRGTSLYGITFTHFLSINATTGASRVVADIGVNMDDMNALAYHPGTNMFFAAGVSGKVVAINPTTGRGRLIGTFGSGIGSSGDLAVNGAGVLFATVRTTTSFYDSLAVINRTTGRASVRGNIGYSGVYGLSFRNGVLFAMTAGGTLLRINTSTGVGTPVGSSGILAGGLTTSP